MNASYTLIVGPWALAAGVFTRRRRHSPAKWQAHQLQNRDKHQVRSFWKNALA